MFFIGIDVAKRSHQAAVTDISGNVIVKPFNFKNSSDGFTKFLSIVESNVIEKNDCTIGLESTGHYWYPLYFFLKKNQKAVLCKTTFYNSRLRAQSKLLRAYYSLSSESFLSDIFLIYFAIKSAILRAAL